MEYCVEICLALDVLKILKQKEKEGWKPLFAVTVFDKPSHVDLYFERKSNA